MTEELKYKVGDKVLIEAEIEDVRHELAYPYILNATDGTPLTHVNENFFNKPCVRPLTKPKVTQEIMDWYEETENEKVSWCIVEWLNDSSMPQHIHKWLYKENHLDNQQALATLIAYGPEAVEVEKDKQYQIVLKATGQRLYFDERTNKFIFIDGIFSSLLTKQELFKAGFQDVFNNPMFEVEEIE